MIDQLPRHSRFVEAMTEDEDLAEQMIDSPEPPEKPGRRMSEFTPVVELLSVCADRLAELTQVVAATGGAKPHRVKPMPRPRFAMDKIRKRRREREHKSLVSRLLPSSQK